MLETYSASSAMSRYCGIAIFLFALLALTVPSGYSLGAMLLLLGGLYTLTQFKVELNRSDYVLLGVLALFSIEGAINNLCHQLGLNSYDKIIRFAFAIPVFFLIRWTKPQLHWAWLGLGIGTIGTGITAIVQKFMMGISRAEGYTHTIQFGNLSMLSALFCLAGLGWASGLEHHKRKPYLILLSLGAVSGIFGSLLSGSRGGWVGLPFVLLVLFKAYHSFFHLRTKIMASGLLTIAALAVFYTPQLHVQDRIYAAFQDVQQYQQGNSNTSVGARFEMWHGAIQLIKEKPITGWSKGGYQPAMQHLAKQGKANPVVSQFGHAHNELIDQTAKRGLVGLMTLLALYLVPLWYFSPYLSHSNLAIRSISVAGTLLSVAYIDFGLSQVFFAHNSGVMMFAFWLMIWAGLLRNTIEHYTMSAANQQ